MSGWTPPTLAATAPPGPWIRSAACRALDMPEHVRLALFMPKDGPSGHQPVKVCGRCPVLRPCLEYALTQGDDLHGVWGGTTQNQRRRLREQLLADGPLTEAS